MATTPTPPGCCSAAGSPRRRPRPSMTEAELRAYLVARETLRRLKPPPWPCFASGCGVPARPPGRVPAR